MFGCMLCGDFCIFDFDGVFMFYSFQLCCWDIFYCVLQLFYIIIVDMGSGGYEFGRVMYVCFIKGVQIDGGFCFCYSLGCFGMVQVYMCDENMGNVFRLIVMCCKFGFQMVKGGVGAGFKQDGLC